MVVPFSKPNNHGYRLTFHITISTKSNNLVFEVQQCGKSLESLLLSSISEYVYSFLALSLALQQAQNSKLPVERCTPGSMVFSGQGASASSRNLLIIHVLNPHPRSTEAETLRLGSTFCVPMSCLHDLNAH